MYATVIEKRLLQAQANEHLVLAFQVCPARTRSRPATTTTTAAAAAAAAPTLDAMARDAIEGTVADCGGNLSVAARRPGVSCGLLYRRRRSTVWLPADCGAKTRG